MAMGVKELAARERRLDELARGLAAEVALLKSGGDGEDVLLTRERKAYLEAVHDALAGVETARVVLAKARQRREG